LEWKNEGEMGMSLKYMVIDFETLEKEVFYGEEGGEEFFYMGNGYLYRSFCLAHY
jgi:hypothetical protein